MCTDIMIAYIVNMHKYLPRFKAAGVQHTNATGFLAFWKQLYITMCIHSNHVQGLQDASSWGCATCTGDDCADKCVHKQNLANARLA